MTSPDDAAIRPRGDATGLAARRRRRSRLWMGTALVLACAAVVLVTVAAVSGTGGASGRVRDAVWIDHAGVHVDGRTFALRVSSPTVLTLTSAGAVYGTSDQFWLQPRSGPARRLPIDTVPVGQPDSSVVGWITYSRYALVFHAYDVATHKVVATHAFDVGLREQPRAQTRSAPSLGVLSIDNTTAYLSEPDGLWRYDWAHDPGPVKQPTAGSSVVDIDGTVRVVPSLRTAVRGTLRVRFERATGPAVPAAVAVLPSASGLSTDGRYYVSGGRNAGAGHGFAPPVVVNTSTGRPRHLPVAGGTTSGLAWGFDRRIVVAADVIAPNDAYVRTNMWVCDVAGGCARIGTVDGVGDLLLPGGQR